MRIKLTLSIKVDIGYFLVYIRERNREVIKLEALGFGRESISRRTKKGEVDVPKANLALPLPGLLISRATIAAPDN